jgi:hypothetical protein
MTLARAHRRFRRAVGVYLQICNEGEMDYRIFLAEVWSRPVLFFFFGSRQVLRQRLRDRRRMFTPRCHLQVGVCIINSVQLTLHEGRPTFLTLVRQRFRLFSSRDVRSLLAVPLGPPAASV